jgi:hypothetical protein
VGRRPAQATLHMMPPDTDGIRPALPRQGASGKSRGLITGSRDPNHRSTRPQSGLVQCCVRNIGRRSQLIASVPRYGQFRDPEQSFMELSAYTRNIEKRRRISRATILIFTFGLIVVPNRPRNLRTATFP